MFSVPGGGWSDQQREYDDSYDCDDWDDADDSISGALSILVALVMLIWQYLNESDSKGADQGRSI